MTYRAELGMRHNQQQRSLRWAQTVGAAGAVTIAALTMCIVGLGPAKELPELGIVLMWLTTIFIMVWLVTSMERRMAHQLRRVEQTRYRDGYVDGYVDAVARRGRPLDDT